MGCARARSNARPAAARSFVDFLPAPGGLAQQKILFARMDFLAGAGQLAPDPAHGSRARAVEKPHPLRTRRAERRHRAAGAIVTILSHERA